MNKYHISADGEAKRCTADDGKCPLKNSDGNPAAHGNFASDAEARSFAEEINKAKFGGSFAQASEKPAKLGFNDQAETENFTTIDGLRVPIFENGGHSVAVATHRFGTTNRNISDYTKIIQSLRQTPWPAEDYEDPAATEQRFRKWLRGSQISRKDHLEVSGALKDLTDSPQPTWREAALRLEKVLPHDYESERAAWKADWDSAQGMKADTRSPSEVLRDLGDLTEAPEDVLEARKAEIYSKSFSEQTDAETMEVAAINSEFERRMWARRDAAKKEAEFSLPEDPDTSA